MNEGELHNMELNISGLNRPHVNSLQNSVYILLFLTPIPCEEDTIPSYNFRFKLDGSFCETRFKHGIVESIESRGRVDLQVIYDQFQRIENGVSVQFSSRGAHQPSDTKVIAILEVQGLKPGSLLIITTPYGFGGDIKLEIKADQGHGTYLTLADPTTLGPTTDYEMHVPLTWPE